MTDAEIRQAAVSYAEAGLRVFPVAIGTKRPLIKTADVTRWQARMKLADWQKPGRGGQHTATDDPRVVGHLWSGVYAGARIGYAIPPDVVVLDVDRGDALTDLRDLQPGLYRSLHLRVMEQTPIARTPRGMHVYARLPEGVRVRQTHASAIAHLPHDHPRMIIDLKACGGWTILPPSAGYAWKRGDLRAGPPAYLPPDWTQALERRPEPPLPEPVRAWLPGRPPEPRRAVCLRPSTFRRPLAPEPGTQWPRGTPRHPILRAVGCAMVAAGAGAADVLARLREVNGAWFADPKADRLLVVLANDLVYRYGKGGR